ncbi:MAG: hypothetical protein ACP5N1_06455 [Candidatus Woesearchaeota archaeon]
MDNSKLITLRGSVEDTIKKFYPTTIQHARDIQKERYTNSKLLGKGFLTGDLPVYTLEDDYVILYLADREHNLILRNIDNAKDALKHSHNYYLGFDEMDEIINAKSTIKVNLDNMLLNEFDSEESYLFIRTSNNDKTTPVRQIISPLRKPLIEKLHGCEDDFKNTMNMLYHNGIEYTRIILLNPSYVRETLEYEHAQGLARLAFIYGSFNNSSINLTYNDLEHPARRMRGIGKGNRITK